MKVARLHAPGDLRVADEHAPVPTGGEELLRVSAVGICGSDLHWFGVGGIGDAVLDHPLVLGHEIGGTVASGPRAGQRVAVDPSVPCWACAACRRGNPNLCTHVVFAGYGGTDGGLREYMTWPADRLHPVPDSLSDQALPMLEPLGVAFHALDLTHPRYGETIGIVGCGPIGVIAVQLAQLAAARPVLAVEPLAHRRAMAAEFGAVAVPPEEAVTEAASMTGGEGLDAVIEIAGTDDAVQCGIDVVRPGGRLVLAGIPDDDRTSFIASSARRKGLTIAMSRRMREVYPRAIAFASSKRVDLDAVVTHQFPLEDAATALRSASERTTGKVIILP